LAAHASLVTTNFGVACFIFGTIYFLWRTCRRPSAGNITGLTIFLTLSVMSKFSALLLGPLAVLLLALAVSRRTLTAARAAALMTLLAFDELDGTSKLRFGAHLGRFLRMADSLYLGVLDGTLDQRLWRGYERTLADEFYALIDRHIQTAKPKIYDGYA
jgi:hypothetical protein